MNIFQEIRRKLALRYTGIMAFFFIVLVFCVHMSIVWSIASEQENEVLLFAEEEAIEHVVLLQHRELLEKQKLLDHAETIQKERKLFFYVYDVKGELVHFSAPNEAVEREVLSKMENWNANKDVIEMLEFGGEYKLLMTTKTIEAEGEILGTLYVGRDVTDFYKGMRKATASVVFVAVCALFIAAFAGYVMAGRAIVPIKRAYERQREFTADASHELRTPLSVILSSVEVLQLELQDLQDSFVLQVLDDMKDETKKMARLVADLLLLARSDQYETTLRKKAFILEEVAAQIIRRMQPIAEKKQIWFMAESTEKHEILADAERLQQLFVILLDNAIKYTPQGGKVTLKINDEKDRSKVYIVVSDTGEGIALEDQKKIFERFYRVDKVRSREKGGFGLGLAIAKWIVEAHGGSICVESERGKGTAFIVTLPLK